MACICLFGRRGGLRRYGQTAHAFTAPPHYHGLTLQLPSVNISLNLMSNYAVVVFTFYLIFGYVNVIMKGGVGKNGSTVAVRVSLSVPSTYNILRQCSKDKEQNGDALS